MIKTEAVGEKVEKEENRERNAEEKNAALGLVLRLRREVSLR